jgi:acyl-CoA hydrolase/GNAT superfamily N-acetyltransferase
MMSADWQTRFGASRTTAVDAIRKIPRGKHIFIGSGAAEPTTLVEALAAEHAHFADNQIVHLLTLGPAPYVKPEFQDHFRHNAFFIGPNVRAAVHDGRADYTPVFLSQIPRLMKSRRLPIDVALIQVSPPDRFGLVNLGVSVDIVLAAIEAASLVIAEINPNMPVVHGAGFVPMTEIDAWVPADTPLPVLSREPPDTIARDIGRHVASLIEDGSTLQAGIGQIPDAILAALGDKHDLGVWTEMFPEGFVDLMEAGNVTRKVTASFTFGTKRVYEFVHENPMLSFQPSDIVNDPTRIARQHKMVAINAALQVDLTGQVCSDSIGTRFYSGIGGQVDFIRGASMCPGGKPIIALRSTAKKGTVSRIVSTLDEGAGVVTSRGDVRYVVTEYGIADLEGKSVRERALALISIAHPDFRSELLDGAKRRRYVFADQIVPRKSYPVWCEQSFMTRDGVALRLRPIRETDESKLADLFYRLSETTVYRRWMHVVPRMPHAELQRYLDVDDKQNVALVVETGAGNKESELVALGMYRGDRATNLADVALVVGDEWQGRGIGQKLMAALVEFAQKSGIQGFTAEVLAQNGAMMHVFHKSGLDLQSRLEGDTYYLEMLFPAQRRNAGR